MSRIPSTSLIGQTQIVFLIAVPVPFATDAAALLMAPFFFGVWAVSVGLTSFSFGGSPHAIPISGSSRPGFPQVNSRAGRRSAGILRLWPHRALMSSPALLPVRFCEQLGFRGAASVAVQGIPEVLGAIGRPEIEKPRSCGAFLNSLVPKGYGSIPNTWAARGMASDGPVAPGLFLPAAFVPYFVP